MKEFQETKLRIKKLAKDFGMKYNSKIFNMNLVSKKDLLLLKYISTCPELVLVKYGKDVKTRIKNLDKFLKSKDFKIQSKKSGGSIFLISEVKKNFKMVKNEQIQKIPKLLKNKTLGNRWAIVISKTTKRELKFLFDMILFHEWVHVLLSDNKIYFQKIKKSYWKYDEGLTTYMCNFSDGSLNKLAERYEREKNNKNSLLKIYLKNALIFSKLLDKCNRGKERKIKIIGFYNKLKK